MMMNLCGLVVFHCCLFFFFILFNGSNHHVNAMKVIYREMGPNNTDYIVYNRNEGKERCMGLGNPMNGHIFGCSSLNNPNRMLLEYTRLMMAPLYYFSNLNEIKRVLLIGLGPGVLVNAYRKQLPNARIDIVEFDERIVRLNKEYFKFNVEDNDDGEKKKSTTNTRLILSDGYEYLLNGSRDDDNKEDLKYDIILVDAFFKSVWPDHFRTKHFLRLVELAKNKQNANSVVAFNMYSKMYNPTYEEDILLFRTYFNNKFYSLVSSEGNHIILAQTCCKLKNITHIVENSARVDLKPFLIDRSYLLNQFQII